MRPKGPLLTNGTVHSPFSRNSRTGAGKSVPSCSPFDHAKTKRHHKDWDLIPDQAACGRSGGREAAREPNSWMFILQLLLNTLRNAEQRRASFVLAVHTAFGLLSSPPSQVRRGVEIQNETASKPRSPPEGSLRDSAAYSINARTPL